MIGSEIRPIEITLRRDDARRRREQRADEDHRVGEAAAHRPEQLADRVEQVLGHAGALEDQPHEREERHREQRVVRHHAPDALGQRLEQRRLQQAEVDAEEAERDADGGQRERHRKAEQQDDDQADEHQRRDVGDQPGAHRRPRASSDVRGLQRAHATLRFELALARDLLGELLLGGLRVVPLERIGMWPRRNAMRLMSSETPCRISSANPTGTSSRAGQMMRPPALVDTSLRTYESTQQRPRQPAIMIGHREQEEDDAEDVDPVLRARGQAARDDVDAHVLVAQQRVAGAEQEDRREQVPLDLEEGVRAEVERLADDGVGGADQHDDQDQPVDEAADALVDRVDDAGQGEQGFTDASLTGGRPSSVAATEYVLPAGAGRMDGRDYSGMQHRRASGRRAIGQPGTREC